MGETSRVGAGGFGGDGLSSAGQVEGPSMSTDRRLEAYARSLGGSSDPAVFGAAGLGVVATAAGIAGGTPVAREFLRAVAGRRVSVLFKLLLGIGGVAGVLAVIVMLALQVPPTPTQAPQPRREEEPTFWNLRAGVEDPSGLDHVAGLVVEGGTAAQGAGGEVLTPEGVSPGTWPDDIRPR